MQRRVFMHRGFLGLCGVLVGASVEGAQMPFGTETFVSYNPTNYNPTIGQYPSTDSIKADLDVLVGAGLTGIITYGANNGLAPIPRLAKEAGFRKVIMGIWDIHASVIDDQIASEGTSGKSTSGGNEEWNNALSEQAHVDAYCAGNEGLYQSGNGGYTFYELVDYHNALRQATGKPVTSSEVDPHYDQAWVMDNGDFLLPNIHPYWGGIRDAEEGVQMVQDRYATLASRANGRLMLLKETGFPTEGETDVSETLQKDFYARLQNTDVKFSFFEAFDQPWKNWHPVEPHWGLFRTDRSAKQVVGIIQPSSPTKGALWTTY